MLEYCHGRDAYVQFQDTLFAQVQALICNGKPIGGLVIDANKYFDKAKVEMQERRKSIELPWSVLTSRPRSAASSVPR